MFQVDNISHSDVNQLIEISKTCFGDGYLSADDFKLVPERRLIRVVHVKLIPVGFCISIISENCAVIKSIAVDPSFQKKGMGRLLVEDAIQNLKKLSVVEITCIAWSTGEHIPIKPLLLDMGFVKDKVINNYWSKDSIENNYRCAICGAPPCECDAVIFKIPSSYL